MNSEVFAQLTEKYLENCLGAFSRGLSDKIVCAVCCATNLTESACCAIVQIGTEPYSSIEMLRRMLALEHSSTVRLIDRLENQGLLRRLRDHGQDMRKVQIILTDMGEDYFTKILMARQNVLQKAMSVLNKDELNQLIEMINKIMPAVLRPGDDQHYVCRLCDLENCPQEICPVKLAHPDCFELPEKPFKRPKSS